MRYFQFIFIVLLFIASGCASSPSETRTENNYTAYVNNSPDIVEIDAQLNSLEIETQNLEESYNGIQENVLMHTNLTGDDLRVRDDLKIFINDNNVLIVNEKAMSRNDFVNFATRNLPALCDPAPKLSIHKKANYDTAAWVLETIYSHGCTNVDVE